MLLAALRSHENHIEVFRKPGILRCWARRRPGDLCKLDPFLATSIREALGDFYVAFALVVSRQAAEVPESQPNWRRRRP
jgi:hypothetical protein